MNVTILTPPSGEPLSLADARAYAQIGHDSEDAILADLIAAARAHIEAETGLALLTRELSLTMDRWPSPAVESGVFKLPIGPAQALVRVRTIDADGAETDCSGEYVLELGQASSLKLIGAHWPWPVGKGGRIEIVWQAGFGSDVSDIPADLTHALGQLVAHYYEHRTGGDWRAARALPSMIDTLIAPWREIRL